MSRTRWTARGMVALVPLALLACQAADPRRNTAVEPVSKLEDDSYDWWARHRAVLALQRTLDPDIVLIGDSITHFWDGVPPGPARNGPRAWARAFHGRRVLNLGFGWDRTQNVLWRLDHGEFGGLSPQAVVLNIGSNNFTRTAHARENTPEEVAEGIAAICDRVAAASPGTRIILMAVFPRGASPTDPYRAKIARLNVLLARFATGRRITFVDVGPKLLDPDGRLPPEMMADAIHPTEKGYAVWAAALEPLLRQ